MKKLCVILSLFGVLNVYAESVSKDEIRLADYGYNSGTLSNLLSRKSYGTYILDGGPIYITNNVIVPQNVTLDIRQYSGLYWAGGGANKRVTYSNCWIKADPSPAAFFTDVPSAANWAHTGTVRVIARWDNFEYAPGVSFSEGLRPMVGGWFLTDYPYTDTDYRNDNPTNFYPFLDTNYTDDVTSTNVAVAMTNAYPNLDTNAADDVNIAQGYIKDAWVSYAATNQVYVNVGEGYCNGKYFSITGALTHAISGMTALTNFHYVYIDDDLTTYPSTISLTNTTTGPTYSASKSGYYNGNDRILGVVITTNNGVERFVNTDGLHVRSYWNPIDSSNSPAVAGTWSSPDYESSNVLPVNASHALVAVQSFSQTGDDAVWYLTTKEMADLTPTNANGAIISGSVDAGTAPIRGGEQTVVPLGASRNIRITSSDLVDVLSVWIQGWRIHR